MYMALAFTPMMKKRSMTRLKLPCTMPRHCEFNRKTHQEDQAHRAGFLTPLDPGRICTASVNSFAKGDKVCIHHLSKVT